MANRSAVLALFLFTVLSLRLPAQSNTAEIFGGYSYAKINPESALPKQNAHGWVGSATGYAISWFGAGMEIAAHFGDIPAPPARAHPACTSRSTVTWLVRSFVVSIRRKHRLAIACCWQEASDT